MSEIDVRNEDNEMVDKIRFNDQSYLDVANHGVWLDGENITQPVFVHQKYIPDLIKAFRKYMELYG